MLLTELEHFIEEDIGYNDVSCNIIPDCKVQGEVVTNENGIVAGLAEAAQVFEYFDVFAPTDFIDGNLIKKNDVIFALEGGARSILRAERLALNFIGRMSGIATLTRRYVERANGPRIAGTRKTIPGFRKFEKKAVIAGGGDPHRFNLSDAVMIKDNHIAVIGLEKAVNNAKKTASFTQKIEVEVENAESAVKAAELGVDIIMFDNMPPGEIENAVKILKKKGLRDNILLEASGGISLENVVRYARTGVDVISVGALTRSSNWLDMSLRITKT
ncbi:MAG: carboxylating nicotinate-nucleotide diphosphorylase [Candidatus Methanoperedens sp.]|nr:carboxylating nicotinate-nucleotide diphosphorylase [Candidatus Methanoperedens sp.]